jgi:hypothetical protein
MGRTYYKSSKPLDDSEFGNRSGKPAKHASGKKTGGMRTINNYVEEDYDLNNEDFDDDIELDDNIEIQHTKNKP